MSDPERLGASINGGQAHDPDDEAVYGRVQLFDGVAEDVDDLTHRLARTYVRAQIDPQTQAPALVGVNDRDGGEHPRRNGPAGSTFLDADDLEGVVGRSSEERHDRGAHTTRFACLEGHVSVAICPGAALEAARHIACTHSAMEDRVVGDPAACGHAVLQRSGGRGTLLPAVN